MSSHRQTATARPAARPAPLAGWHVVVTRPAGQQATLRRALATHGATVVALPAMSIRGGADPVAIRRGLRAAARADRIVFVSPNAVRHAYAVVPDWTPGRRAIVYAIGAATRRALARHGVEASIPAAGANSEALLHEPAFIRVRGLAVHLVGAPGGRELIERGLRARGATVAFTAVYRREPTRWDARHRAKIAALRPPLATIWSSSDAFAAFEARLSTGERARLRAGVAVVASERIATVVRAAGYVRIVRARSALVGDLVAALVQSVAAPRAHER